MIDFLIEKIHDPRYMTMIFAAIAASATVYTLVTPFFAADYEDHHLPIPASLDANISYSWYPSGHMVYAHEPSLKLLHDNVVRFIGQTDNLGSR
mgnify:CR=1 FL=1